MTLQGVRTTANADLPENGLEGLAQVKMIHVQVYSTVYSEDSTCTCRSVILLVNFSPMLNYSNFNK